jgi:hypothetical protein
MSLPRAAEILDCAESGIDGFPVEAEALTHKENENDKTTRMTNMSR